MLIDSFEDNVHGLIGTDFFMRYLAKLDYENFLFSFNVNNKQILTSIHSKYENYACIPARHEVIKCFHINTNEECVVIPDEICEGVFVAGMLVKSMSNRIPVRILNTRNQDVNIKNFTPKIVPLYYYDICQYNPVHKTVDRIDKLLNTVKLDHLEKSQKFSLQKICSKYSDVFHLKGETLTTTNIYKQKIHLQPNTSPVYVKPYRLPYSQKTELDKQIGKMLREKTIEEASSPWSAPILLVPKKADEQGNKTWRLVIDYRKTLNSNIQDDKFPLPCMSEILDSLSGAIYFSHLDLSQGYYQIELEKESRPCTAFVTDRGQFQMTRLPMGLKISPSSFSRAMSIALSGLTYSSCFVYLDDLIIFGNTLETHNSNLIKVLQRLRDVNLKLNPEKCDFLKKELLYLGHVISADGVCPDPQKVQGIQNYPVPKDEKEVKRFVASANFYRKSIKHFAQIVAPLNYLTRKGVHFQWTPECQEAFELLKQALVSPPVLQFPNFSEDNTFIVTSDASNKALGATLSNGDGSPVSYISRQLNKAEVNYPVIEKELLGIVFAVKSFRNYLFGRKFIIYTDHRPLVYLFGMNNPSSRLTKFRLLLEEYDFDVRYVKGSNNVVADALSRIETTSEELKQMANSVCNTMFVMTRQQAKNELKKQSFDSSVHERLDHPGVVELLKPQKNSCEAYCISELEFNNLSKNKKYDYCTSHIIFSEKENALKIKNSRSTFACSASLRELKNICIKYKVPEIYILKNNNNAQLINIIGRDPSELKMSNIKISIIKDVQKITNIEMRQIILNDFHILPSGGHTGINRMYNNIKKYYFWPSLHSDVNDFVKRCDHCQRFKHSRPNIEPMSITTTASSAFQKLFLDLVGPLPEDIYGNKYILTLQCELSKFVEGYPIQNKEAKTIAKSFVDNFILRYGIPETIVSDQGTELIATTLKEACKILQIKQLASTAYHHQTLGSLENTHKNLGAYLRIQTAEHPDSWSSWVQFWCFAFNNTVHTNTKYTPYELVFGKQCKLPSNIDTGTEPLYNFDNYPLELKYRLQKAWDDAKNNLVQSKIKRKKSHDSKVNAKTYKKGDQVLVKNETGNKLEQIFNGPYVVVEDKSPNLVILVGNKIKEIHKNRAKLYNNSTQNL